MRRKIAVLGAAVLGVITALASVPALAQAAGLPPAMAACGPDNVRYSVKTDPVQPAAPEQAPAGKALVVLVENVPRAHLFVSLTLRVGLDGNWVGATRAREYMSFAVDPGVHHLCSSLQGAGLTDLQDPIALHTLNVEAGKTYYFQVRLFGFGQDAVITSLDPVDGDEGRLLMQTMQHSVARAKK
jgi:hypothetical protein